MEELEKMEQVEEDEGCGGGSAEDGGCGEGGEKYLDQTDSVKVPVLTLMQILLHIQRHFWTSIE